MNKTGYYYFGARYYDPMRSVWTTSDPAMNEYFDDVSKGEGGVYNPINLNGYHYGGNNPIKYVDPDGETFKGFIKGVWNTTKSTVKITLGSHLMLSAAGGEILGAGISTPVAVGAGLIGFCVFIDGFSDIALSMANMMQELIDCFTPGDTRVNIPSNLGGLWGQIKDSKNMVDTNNNKGPEQIKGESIHTLISNGISFATGGIPDTVLDTINTIDDIKNTVEATMSLVKDN